MAPWAVTIVVLCLIALTVAIVMVLKELGMDIAPIIAGAGIRYDGAFMDEIPTLRVISRTGIGVDNIVIPDATARGIALGSVAPIPLRCVQTEAALRGQPLSPDLIRAAQTELAREIRPIDDMRSSAAYRSRVAQNLLAEFLTSTANRT